MKVATFVRSAGLATLIVAVLAAPSVEAATFCVTSGNALNNAFDTAKSNHQNDEIRIVQGTHTSNVQAPQNFQFLFNPTEGADDDQTS